MIAGQCQVYHRRVGYFNSTTQGPTCRMNVTALLIRFLKGVHIFYFLTRIDGMVVGRLVYHITVGYSNPTTQGPTCRMNVTALLIRF